ncbi:MAG: GNAT family N-acetyltransferase [Crocosphaera sp.]|nr:GNAT family N-acetyltransferase [Crocosphaera sp.]
MSAKFSNNYYLKRGKTHDKATLIKLMQLTYEELFPNRSNFSHLSKTVEQYLSAKTPIWWIKSQIENNPSEVVAGLWMGTAIDQVSGDRYGHIFLIYVMPKHRRQGLATALIKQGKQWVEDQGYHQLGLQVFEHNQVAQKLYHKLGFVTQSHLMLQSF